MLPVTIPCEYCGAPVQSEEDWIGSHLCKRSYHCNVCGFTRSYSNGEYGEEDSEHGKDARESREQNEMPTVERLKSCPFCHKKAEIVHSEPCHEDGVLSTVRCTNGDCYGSGFSAWYTSDDEAVRHWNTCNELVVEPRIYCEWAAPEYLDMDLDIYCGNCGADLDYEITQYLDDMDVYCPFCGVKNKGWWRGDE